MKINNQQLGQQLSRALSNNQQHSYTIPAKDIYPHQWLWDSAFVAIGLRHIDPQRAKKELDSLLEAQWTNGMLPHMRLSTAAAYQRDRDFWASHLNPHSPADSPTSGITQPPVITEAVWLVGRKLPVAQRQKWFKGLLPKLISYHQWLLTERDPNQCGLAVLVHPYESGLDNSPSWMTYIYDKHHPLWIKLLQHLGAEHAINHLRRDTKHTPVSQRIHSIDALLHINLLRPLKRQAWETSAILADKRTALVEDLAFNCILVRANQSLAAIAKHVRVKLPEELKRRIVRNQRALDQLWDEQEGHYFSRAFRSQQLIEEPTIASLLPLYAGTISQHQAQRLVDLLTSFRHFGLKYPVPSVPKSSRFFDHRRYWQGPTWINTNWMLIKGLRNYKYHQEADQLRATTLELLAAHGPREYFSPLNGSGLGAKNFSWSAALGLDLLAKP